jgi:Icc-related predicted phosphoesterase
VRLAAVGDLHCTKTSQGAFAPLFEAVSEAADALVLCGDLTDYGLAEEARVLARELGALRVPALAVLGNHDCESDQAGEVSRILTDAGVIVLDGAGVEVRGVGFAGVKGFGGGFGVHALQPWGEEPIKRFAREAVDEALKLESALARLRSSRRVVLLHYSPIVDTILGEPPEVAPFLGSSRLAEPLDRHQVTAVFHGHAHHGQPEGRTPGGVPVYNVCLPVLREHFRQGPPFRVVELPDLLPDSDGRGPEAEAGPVAAPAPVADPRLPAPAS